MRIGTDRQTFFATAVAQIKVLQRQQQGLLARLEIYQINLNELLIQEAKYGIAVPLPLISEISHHKEKIESVREEFSQIKKEIEDIMAFKIYTSANIGGKGRGVIVTCWD